MSKIPDWLPVEIDSYVQTLIQNGGLGATEKVLQRLISHPEMAKVWKPLLRLSKSPQPLIDYLDAIRWHPVVMGYPIDFLNVPGDAKQREAFSKILVACENTLNALKELSHKNDPQVGWGLLEQAMQRNESLAAKTGDTRKLEAIANFQGRLQEILQSSNIVEILEVIRLAACLAGDAPNMPLPRKRDSLKADRVHLARHLSHYVQDQFHKPCHAVVASTINVIFEHYYDPISADAIRKLKPA